MTEPIAPAQLAHDWNIFKAKFNKPASLIADLYAPVGIEVDSRSLDDPIAVRAAITDFAGEQGWLTLTDRHVMLDVLPPDGIILNGELCKQEQSLHIRHQGGCWRVIRYRETPGAVPTHLACDRRIASNTGEHATLGYRIYFHTTPDRGTQPSIARFIGFMEA